MKTKTLFAAVVLFGSAMQAHADTLAGVMWGGPTQSAAICYLFNMGPGAVSITSKAVYAETGGTRPLGNDTCGTSLAAGAICAFGASIPSGGANACRVVLSPSGANVRGEMDIRDSSGVILNSVELR